MSLVIGSATLTRGHEWGDDWASYVMQAKSILKGNVNDFVEHNTFTIFNSSSQIGPIAYPWGYPLMLTPFLWLKGIHPLALKLPGLFFFAGFLVCLYWVMEKQFSRTESLFIVSLFAFNPTLLKFLDQILSDIPLLFFIFLGLFWIMKSGNKSSAWNKLFLGVILFFAFFIRTTGIILLAAFLAHQVIRFYLEKENRGNHFVDAVLVLLAFSALFIVTSLVFPNGQGSYLQQLAGFSGETLRKNIIDYFYLFVQFFDTSSSPAWIYIYYMLAAFFLIGIWARRNTDQLLIVFFVFYFAVMLIWPEWQGIRFIFPLLPLFVYFAFQGMQFVLGKFSERLKQIGLIAFHLFWLMVIGAFLFESVSAAESNLRAKRKINGPFDSFSMEMYGFIKDETPQDSVIVFFKPRALRLFTGRDSIMSTECDHLLRGDYIVLHKNWEYSQILPGQIQDCKIPLETDFESRRFIVYKIIK